MRNFVKKINSSLILRSGVASLDQALLSLLSFLIAIFLIKTVPKTDYGYYSVALPVMLFLIAVQNAIVNTPLAVLLPSKKDAEQKQYAASLFYGQFLLIIPLAGAGLFFIALPWFLGVDSTQGAIAAALCLAATGILYREFLRSYFFAEETPVQVLKLDVGYVFIFSCLVALSYFTFNISVAGLFLLMGISAIIVAPIFKRRLGWAFDKKSIRKSYHENWKYGRWSLFGVIVTHIQTYSYVYLLGMLLGSVAVADVSAARILMMPLVLVESGWGKVVRPYGSKLREQNLSGIFYKRQVLASLVLTFGICLYTLLVLFASGILEKYILSEKYANSFQFIQYWGAVFVVGFIGKNASFGLQVMKDFKNVSIINFITMLITVGYGFFLIQSHGIQGALIAVIIGKGISAIFLWIYFTKSVFFTGENRIKSTVNIKWINN